VARATQTSLLNDPLAEAGPFLKILELSEIAQSQTASRMDWTPPVFDEPVDLAAFGPDRGQNTFRAVTLVVVRL